MEKTFYSESSKRVLIYLSLASNIFSQIFKIFFLIKF